MSVDFAALGGWMDGRGLPTGEFEHVERLAGGTQNVMIRFGRGGREYVLRRGPEHLRAKTNATILREARVLSALDGSGVPAPRVIAACADEAVLGGAVFYLMTLVDGVNPSVGLPEPYLSSPRWRHGMGLAAVDALAKLGAVDHLAVGLADFGRPEGFLERQVGRWLGELESYSALDGYPGLHLPVVSGAADWLERNRPDTWRPGIMHGDYHLGNLLLSRTSPTVAAIVDWEMCTIGDPLLDLGWLLATWPDPEHPIPILGDAGGADGMPSPAEVVARYAERSDRDVSAMDWYLVLACFKLAIILEGTYARACAGKASPAVGELLHGVALTLLAKAEQAILRLDGDAK